MLSLRKSFLSREIHYWCQFCNGVMVKKDSAAWRMLVSKSLVMIHYETTLMCDLLWIPSLKQFLVVCERDQATSVISIGS
jgi:hypothetical protein